MNAPYLTTLPSTDLTPHQRAAVLDLCSRAYEEDYEPCLQGMTDSTHVLAYAGGALVGHALFSAEWREGELW